jgi:hypothetical protein
MVIILLATVEIRPAAFQQKVLIHESTIVPHKLLIVSRMNDFDAIKPTLDQLRQVKFTQVLTGVSQKRQPTGYSDHFECIDGAELIFLFKRRPSTTDVPVERFVIGSDIASIEESICDMGPVPAPLPSAEGC